MNKEDKDFLIHLQSLAIQNKPNEINAKIKSIRLLYDF
jgi:hypothetical protein